MKSKIQVFILTLFLFIPFTSKGQDNDLLIQGIVTSATDGEPLIGVNITEIDANNRLITGAITDVNGRYVLKVKNRKDRISFSYVGYVPQKVKITSNHIDMVLSENATSIQNVEIIAKKKQTQGGFSVPVREIGTAMQTISSKEFEGLQVSSVDEALQGRIAGLDVVSNSSDPGTGASMRIRGVTSINGNNQPLIVINGVPYEYSIDQNFDFANSNQEQYANMLSINPDDILDITVLKDAGSSAIWGSKGANGVIMISTKRGTTGPTRLDYTYRFTRTVQPKGLNMLNGDDFTMLMKESYFNREQDKNASNIPEYNYDKNYSLFEDYNNNTDWVGAVTQVGHISDHYLTLSGGGERANYRVSGGYLGQSGTIIGQKYSRISSRASLDYRVSDRIKVTSEFSLTSSDNDRSYDGILGIAYKKMPNVSIYEQTKSGENTNKFFNIPRTSGLSDEQKYLYNPVALASMATNNLKTFQIRPYFKLQYDLLNPDKQILRFTSSVSFDVNNNNTYLFLPQEATNSIWYDANKADNTTTESLVIFTDNNIVWQPTFENKNHGLMLYGSFQASIGYSSGQGMVTYGVPSQHANDASTQAFLSGASSWYSSWRSLAYMARAHYAYKGRYIIDGTYRIDGSTKFGKDNKFGQFPGYSLKYILSDEEFMKKHVKWLSMFSPRYSWGISGNQPSYEYLFYSKYANYGSYIDQAAIVPNNLRLDNLKWETTTQNNYGIDFGFFDDKLTAEVNIYTKDTKDILFKNYPVSNTSGFSSMTYKNAGSMHTQGWEVNLFANRFIKTKDFSVDFSLNLSNYTNVITDLDYKLLEAYNSDFNYDNGSYLTRIQVGNSFGSIYGFRSLGVYSYDQYVAGSQDDAPVVKDASGHVITDASGKPKDMYFAYGTESQYRFRGGDAKYEDINHDGSIDELDIVYLGNANPKLNGGFGPTFRYKDLSVKLFFNFRYGNKIINSARMYAENMYYDNNQSIAVNWRWRDDGDGDRTTIPRALYKLGYNWLGSDRFVEDGSFIRFKYLNFNYSVPTKYIKKFHLERLNFYLTFNNLYVWTKYTGVDPEVGYGVLTSNGGLSVDNSSTPRTKDFTLGITIGL